MLALSNTILRRIVWNRELVGNTLIHKVRLQVGVAKFTTIVRPDSSNLQVEWTEEGLRCSDETLEGIRSVRLLNQRNNVGPSGEAINNSEKILFTSQSRNRNRTTDVNMQKLQWSSRGGSCHPWKGSGHVTRAAMGAQGSFCCWGVAEGLHNSRRWMTKTGVHSSRRSIDRKTLFNRIRNNRNKGELVQGVFSVPTDNGTIIQSADVISEGQSKTTDVGDLLHRDKIPSRIWTISNCANTDESVVRATE